MDSFKDFSLEERKRKLARMLGKSLEEIEEYSINFLYDSIEHIGSGGAVVFANRHNQSFIYDVPVTGEKIERDLDQIFKYSLDEFLGYVVERKNEKYINILDTREDEDPEVTIRAEEQPVSDNVALYKIDDKLYRGTIKINKKGFNSVLGAVFAVNYKREYQDIKINPELEEVVKTTKSIDELARIFHEMDIVSSLEEGRKFIPKLDGKQIGRTKVGHSCCARHHEYY